MRSFFFFVCSSFILLPLVAGEPENPLQGSLRDPWQVVTGQKEAVQIPNKKNGSHQVHPSPQTQIPFGPSFSDFSAQYGSQLDLSTLGDTAGDSVAQRFARGEGDWNQFQPSQGVFQAGAIFYGDPRALSRDRGPAVTTTATNGWPVFTVAAIFLSIFLLLGIYFRNRHQRQVSIAR